MANYIELPLYLNQEDNELYNSEFNEAVRTVLGDDGWKVATLTTAQVTSLLSLLPNGTIWYNTTTDELQCKKAGTARDILTT